MRKTSTGRTDDTKSTVMTFDENVFIFHRSQLN